MEQVAERLVQFGQSKFGTKHGWKTKFAAALDMKLDSLNPYLNGDRLPGNVLLARLRNQLDAPNDWIMYGEKKGKDEELNTVIPVMYVPVYAHVNAGVKKWVVSEDIVEYIAIPKNPDNTQQGLVVKGNSMADEINDNDIVIVSEKAAIKNNDLAVVEFEDGERCLRRVTFDKNNIILTSKNSAEYPSMIVHKTKIRRLYRVMQHIRKY